MKAVLIAAGFSLLTLSFAHASPEEGSMQVLDGATLDVCMDGGCDPMPVENLPPLKFDPQPIDLLEFKALPESESPRAAELV